MFIVISQCGIWCVRGDEATNKTADLGTIWGRLVDQDGAPVRSVPLRITIDIINDGVITSSVISLESDHEGKFSFVAPKTGNVSLFAFPKLLARSHWQIAQRGDIGDIVLDKGFEPKIRLLTPKGEPISDVFLRLISVPSDLGISVLGEKPTDSSGYCTFPRLGAGQYRIIIDKRRSQNALAELPYAILGQVDSFSNESHEKELVAVETTSATLTFDDGIDVPADARWVIFRTVPSNRTAPGDGWNLSFENDAKHVSKGVYSFDKIPQNVSIGISISRDKNLVFSCSASTEQEAKPILGFLELGSFTEPLNINIFSHKASSVKLSARDKNGKTIDQFFAVGHYPELSSLRNGESWWGEDVMESPYRIRSEQLQKRFIDPRLLVFYNFTRSFEYPSQVTFSWDHATQSAQILNIFPNEKIVPILYDTQGRQGFVETEFAEGEKKELVVVLE